MSQYKKGIETKEALIQGAKKVFLENGLKKATATLICTESNIKLGTLTYYFHRKEDLLGLIYTDYMERCRQFIDSKNLKLSPAQRHIYVVAFYYYNIYSHPKIFRFHREVLNASSMNNVFPIPKEMIEDFACEGTIDEKDPRYTTFVYADNAVRREFNLHYFSKDHRSMDDLKELLAGIYCTAAAMFDIDQKYVYDTVIKAYEFAKKKGDKKITLL